MHGSAHHRTGRLLALLAALLLPVAACSGDGDTAAEEVTVAPATEAIETEEAPTEVDTEMATEAPTDMVTEMEPTETDTGAGTDAGTDTDAAGDTDIVAALSAAGLTSLATAVQTAGLEDELANLPAFTIFAPSDDALLALGTDMPTDPAEIQNLLSYHVVDEEISTSDLSEGENTFTTLEGSELTVMSEGGEVTVGDSGATVMEADIEIGDSGVVHVIDMVLEPGA